MNREINASLTKNKIPTSELIENFNSEMQLMSYEQLSMVLKKLNYLCLNFDPFIVAEPTAEEENIIEEFYLSPLLNDPFRYTNTILQMLNTVETELKQRQS